MLSTAVGDARPRHRLDSLTAKRVHDGMIGMVNGTIR